MAWASDKPGIAQTHSTGIGSGHGGLCTLGNHFPFVLGNGSENVNR
jgi:hypothetical protein